MNAKSSPKAMGIAYVGSAGAGIGFQLAGMEVRTADTSRAMIERVVELKRQGGFAIIFIDEALAKDALPIMAQLNADPLPALLLLPNPSKPENVAAASLRNLLIKAVGSDVFGNKQ